jgi:signal-transduction protein with cAMP-binding, CBS, and nucleotidyltransferase domain
MTSTIADVMTRNPVTVEASDPVRDAARRMREADTGAVIVLQNGQVAGLVTDRDITVRIVADGKPADTAVREACSSDVATVPPDASIQQAVQLMRSKAVRRLPVVENGRPVGMVSLGDLALENDPNSALADISAAPPNN